MDFKDRTYRVFFYRRERIESFTEYNILNKLKIF